MSTMADNVSECFIHFGAFSNEDILISGTRISLCKIVECRTQWCVLDGEAKAVSEKSFDFLTEEEGEQLLKSGEVDVQTDLLYHRKCYQKLTNKRLIEQAVKRVSKLSENDQSRTAEPHQPPRKSRRSSNDSEEGSSKTSSGGCRQRTSGLLPRVCIICKKEELFYTDKVSRYDHNQSMHGLLNLISM